MSRYVIELRPDCKVVQQICESNGQVCIGTRSIQYLEELTADYINENFPTIQQGAYDCGYKDGRNVTETQAYDDAYQRGLSEGKTQEQNRTWAYAKKVVLNHDEGGISISELSEIFDCGSIQQVFRRYTVSEVIKKLEAYEEEQDDKIVVGDIIANNTEPKLKMWVTCFDEIGFCGIAITDFGTVDEGKLYSSCSPKGWYKIGHFDISKILEAMKHD